MDYTHFDPCTKSQKHSKYLSVNVTGLLIPFIPIIVIDQNSNKNPQSSTNITEKGKNSISMPRTKASGKSLTYSCYSVHQMKHYYQNCTAQLSENED